MARAPGVTGAVSLPLATLLAHAADAVAAVRGGRSLNMALAATPAAALPGTQALAFGALRGLGRAQVLRELLAAKAPPPWVDALLLVALSLAEQAHASAPGGEHAARESRAAPRAVAAGYAPHTLVDQAVEAAKRHARSQAGFVNALLRRFLREREALLAEALRQPLAQWNHPPWWVACLQRDWPNDWQALLHFNDERAPMTLRANLRRASVAECLQRLAGAGIAARSIGGQAIELATPRPVTDLPGFAEGHWSVQDLAAQQAAPLLLALPGLRAGARVLDACAAPGGKSAHLLELADIDLLALDADPLRLDKVRQGLQRLGLHARLQAGDARHPEAWWDGRPFDAILLDAPCTASGIVRRHPDVRWLRRPGDVAALARTQRELLDALWPLLAPGGRLVFATCSMFRAEGQEQIDAFLQRAADAFLQPSPGHLLPLADNAARGNGGALLAVADGFFYAVLDKRLPRPR